jgi:hypothetical protein
MTITGSSPKTVSLRSSPVYTALFYASLPILLIVSIWAAHQRLTPGESLFGIRYGFGPVIKSIVQQHRFGSLNETYGWWSYAGRMPVIPFFAAASYWISSKAIVFLVLKNIVCWSLWLCALLRLRSFYKIQDKWLLAPVLLLLLAPYNLSIAGQVEIEEGFLFSLVALLFSLLLTVRGPRGAVALGAVMAAIYLTKSSMLTLCIAAVVWIVIMYRKRNPSLIVVPLVMTSLAVLGWAVYIHSVSGVFAVGADASSWNGWNFYKGNNPYAYYLYPRVNLDVLDKADYAHKLLPFVPVHSEWELSHAQLALGEQYVRDHRDVLFRMDLKKLYVACCDLGEAPQLSPDRPRLGVVISNIVNHLTLACVVAFALVNIARRRVGDAEILAVVLSVSYVLPYFAGFLYGRHMVPIYGLMALTAAVQLSRWQASREPA